MLSSSDLGRCICLDREIDELLTDIIVIAQSLPANVDAFV